MDLCLPNILDGEDKSSPLKNRIRKNYQHLRKWAKRAETNCFRIYDRDIKEYPLAIDFYAGRFCVQYFSYDLECESLINETQETLRSLFGATEDLLFERTRFRRKKNEQYERLSCQKMFFPVLEHGVRFQINLVDYLDTGLFLDHRQTRQLVASLAKGKRLLNLFSYTCSFSVHAAHAGAHFTKSVDLSNTYTEWGRENFRLNSLSAQQNAIIRADCMQFLDEEFENYDIIVSDPPTISRSKKMEKMFDIQQDYVGLLQKALRLLAADGILFFSTNSRRFVFDPACFPGYAAREISEKTLPLDFHNKKIHRCWEIMRAQNAPSLMMPNLYQHQHGAG